MLMELSNRLYFFNISMSYKKGPGCKLEYIVRELVGDG
jgi:hypothetical protein